MPATRLVLAITGIRSEYDILSSVFRSINSHESLELQVVVTGAHLAQSLGETVRLIEKDGFNIVDRVESLLNGDSPSSRVKGMALQLQGLTQAIERVAPDVLLVLGDREEAMNVAIIGNYMNIPVAHICGGDRVIGNADDQIRHAVSKLAHIHFATNRDSADRLEKMGEQTFRIFEVGNPGLDRFLTEDDMSREAMFSGINVDIPAGEPYIVLIQHPLSTEVEHAYHQMRVTLEAVVDLGVCTILTYPNSDPGSQSMIQAIREFDDAPNIWINKTIPRNIFVNLLRRASCLVGNSSAGIMEAPSLKIPVVNVGNRQKGRLHGNNIEFVPHDKRAIVFAIQRALYDEDYKEEVKRCVNPYGDGRSSERIANLLAKIKLNSELLIKDLSY